MPHRGRRHLEQEPGGPRLHPLSGPLREAPDSLPPRMSPASTARSSPVLDEMVGAHRDFRPMYPNFPAQVMAASDLELYVNALAPLLGQLRGRRDRAAGLRHPAELSEGRAGAAQDRRSGSGSSTWARRTTSSGSSPAWSAPTARSRTTTRRSSPGSSRSTGTTCCGSCRRRSRRRRTSPSWPGSF